MDCVTAQRLVSDAMDKLPVDSEQLEAAKSHCNQCSDCGAFVRAMLAIQRAPLPVPPEGLVDRIVEQVRAEANEAARARARALAAPSTGAVIPPAVAEPAPQPVRGFDAFLRRALEPRNRRAAIAWMSSAALLLILAGWGAIAGVRSILSPQAVRQYEFTGVAGDAASTGAAESVPQYGDVPADQLGVTAPGSTAVRFLTLDGVVLTAAAPEAKPEGLNEAGSTRTSLDTGRRAEDRSVYSSGDGRVYLEGPDDTVLSLQPVTFNYQGRLYELLSEPIEAFGAWPTLPEGIRQPKNADGSPTFEEAERDSRQGVFVQRGSTPSEGIALPPSTPLVPALGQCPNWTFWRPRQ